MEFGKHKYKLVVALTLLNSEKDRIKDILKSYNIRLESIYSNLISIMDQLQEINLIEDIKNEDEQIKNLIKYSKIFNNNDNNEINIIKSNATNHINK